MDAQAEQDALIRRRVARNTASNYAKTVLSLGTGFVLTPFILHRLGPTDFGLWVLVGSVVAYGGLFEFGISTAVTKYVAEYRVTGRAEHERRLVASALVLYSALGGIVALLGLVLAPLFPAFFNVPASQRESAVSLVALMGGAAGISLPCMTAAAVLRGLHRFDVANLISVLGLACSAAATIAILLGGGGLFELVGANIAVTLLMQVPSVWWVRRLAPELCFGWRGADRGTIRTVVSFSSSISIVQVAGLMQTKTDEIVIGAVLPVSSVTPYALARRLSELGRILTDQFLKVLLPLASELHAGQEWGRLRSLYIASTRLTLAIFLPIGVTLIVLAGPILTVWVGSSFASYANVVVILTIASFVNVSQWPAASVFQGMGRYRALAIGALCSGVVNLVLSIALARPFGLVGVAYATLIPTVCESLGFVLPYSLRALHVSPSVAAREIAVPAFLPVIPMVAVLYAWHKVIEPDSWLAIAVVGGTSIVTYVLGYLSLGTSHVERQAWQTVALGTLRSMGARLRRS